METLEPCPFCGGAAEIVHARNYYAWCDSCETRGDWYSTEAEAIKAWNTRAQTVFGMTLYEVRQMMKRDAERERTCGNLWRSDFMCTRCGTAFSAPNGLHYCPNCGAKVAD